jgi:hypothetical protein
VQLAGHRHIGRESLFLEQLAHQFHGCSLIASLLHQQVENLTSVVNRAPEPELRALNSTAISSRCHLDVGRGRRWRSSPPNNGPNFKTHRRTVSYETSSPLREQIFDVAIAEREPHIGPDRALDDRRRKLVAGKRDRHAPYYPEN